MPEEKRFFTISEAEKLIPWLSKHLKKVLVHKKAIERIATEHQEFSKLIEISSDDGFQFMLGKNVQANRLFHAHCLEFYDYLNDIIEKGIIIKDLDQGLIDFPHKSGTHEVLLCWKLGEKGILYWHDIKSGFVGRQLILNLDQIYRK